MSPLTDLTGTAVSSWSPFYDMADPPIQIYGLGAQEWIGLAVLDPVKVLDAQRRISS
jgi:hypothetical protein